MKIYKGVCSVAHRGSKVQYTIAVKPKGFIDVEFDKDALQSINIDLGINDINQLLPFIRDHLQVVIE
ncbi:hypothetical protein HYX03_00550 [Candidatus Woesearchaeota archaeon]|nr:hypothetical protein [Candidatus Woesearchaeota archaeon]